jgi:hypothetical protein
MTIKVVTNSACQQRGNNPLISFIILLCLSKFITICLSHNYCDKGKVHPRTGHEGPEGEYRYTSTLSLTLVLDGGGWST